MFICCYIGREDDCAPQKFGTTSFLIEKFGDCSEGSRVASSGAMKPALAFQRLVFPVLALVQDILWFLVLGTHSKAALKAENLFLRKQLALYLEREVKPRRATDATRLSMVLLSRLFSWRNALVHVASETFLPWQRMVFRLLWRWKSRPRGRPRVPVQIRELVRRMARENRLWGEERIAAELLLKLGIQLSARTVRRNMPRDTGPRQRVPSQRWLAFVRNHAQAILACDFFIVVTARLRILYEFVAMEVGTGKIGHFNVTAHPTADWTPQQFREVATGEPPHRFVLHDGDSIFSTELDLCLRSMGVKVLRTPYRAPQANAFCERLIGTMRRGCLDFVIPWNERHVRRILKEWVKHYNEGQPHSSLGPGIPEPESCYQKPERCGHDIPRGHRVVAKALLNGLHHEYRPERTAA
jgi:putative transposase